ncbi:heptaprenyl diphosphate synthase [Methylophilaceae bacterium]|nr:heptaprenyl diphosphate synthase [Methylophilaceae bacterium]
MDKQKEIIIRTTADDHRIAKLAALAIGLHLVEAIVPSPLPGVKPGIANIVTLYVLYRYDFATAAWVSLLRVFAGSLLLGHMLSPTFILSLAGAAASLLALWLGMRLPQKWFGPVSLSIFAAFAHIGGQLLVVRLWLIPHAGVAYLIPVFALAALIFGVINGLVTAKLLHTSHQTNT